MQPAHSCMVAALLPLHATSYPTGPAEGEIVCVGMTELEGKDNKRYFGFSYALSHGKARKR